MKFEFATANRIIFGNGTLVQIGPLARECGKRVLLVTGRNPQRSEKLQQLLRGAGLEFVLFPVAGEPEIQTVSDGVASAKREKCDSIISFGGGSAIDTGKAVAAMLANPGNVLDYIEIIGAGKTLTQPSLPFIAIPTTAGTGSEVTRNAVLSSPEHRIKCSLRSPHMLPKIALVDPELTWDVPPDITAYTGFDALTQLIEPYVSTRANPFTDALCREGLQRCARSLQRVYEDKRDASAREDMALASLLGGIALANAGLGAVHGFAGVIGGMTGAPHGAICAALLVSVTKANYTLAETNNPAVSEKFNEIARLLTRNAFVKAEQGVDWLQKVVNSLKVKPLGKLGLKEKEFDEVIQAAAQANSMKTNPTPLSPKALGHVLDEAA